MKICALARQNLQFTSVCICGYDSAAACILNIILHSVAARLGYVLVG